jgi:hypothetical protein
VLNFRDEGEGGEKKREWKDEKKSEELSGDNKEEKDEDKVNDDKDKVGNMQPYHCSLCVCVCARVCVRFPPPHTCLSHEIVLTTI